MFDDLWRAHSPAIDAVFGDLYLFIPMRISNGRPAPDTTRGEFQITAALIEQPKEIPMEGKRVAANTASPLGSAVTALDWKAESLPYAPKVGDRLRRLDTGALYEIEGLRPDGIARTTATVFERSSVL